MDFVEVPVSEDVPSAKGKFKKQKKQQRSGEKSEKSDEVASAEPAEPTAASLPPTGSLSEIKNKQRRHLMFMKLKQEKRKVSVRNVKVTLRRVLGCSVMKQTHGLRDRGDIGFIYHIHWCFKPSNLP